MPVAQRSLGVDRDLGTEQVGSRPLELEHVEQVPVVGDVATQAAWRGEREAGDPVLGSELDQLGGVRADLLLGCGRQVRWLGKGLAHAIQSTGRGADGPFVDR